MDEKSIIKQHYQKIGRLGGQSRSAAKSAANAENAKRKRKLRIPEDQLTDAQRKRRERDARRKERLASEKE